MSIQCNCPRCGSKGRSVAAMNYKETSFWNVSKEYHEFGLIFSKNGVIHEQGIMQTKRAARFDEPQRYTVDNTSKMIPAFISIVFCIFGFPMIFNMLSTSGGGNPNINIEDFFKVIEPYWPFVAIPLVMLYGFNIFSRLKKDEAEEYELNAKVLPQEIKRYNEILYCYQCHSLYDDRKNIEDGSSEGFNAMMAIGPKS